LIHRGFQVVNIDAGTLTGVTGAILATISLIYARSQAHTQRCQVEEMQRQTEETRRAQHFETSHALMKDAIAARQAWAVHFRKEWAPPTVGTALERPMELLDGNWDLIFRVRAYVEQLQEMFFARKADLVADDHWMAMHWLMRGFFAPEIDRIIFESFVQMDWVTPEFAKFGREFSTSGIWKDPLGRLEPIQGRSLIQQRPV
jgi:hypothetical protein